MIIVFHRDGLVFAGKTVFGFLVCSNYPSSSSALISATMTQKLGAVLNCVKKCGCHVYHVCGVVFSTFENYLLDRISFVPGTESHHLCCPFPLSRANSTRGRSCKKHLLNYYYRVVILYILLRMQKFKIIVIIIFFK